MRAASAPADSWAAEQIARPHRLLGFVLAAAVLWTGALVGVASTVGFDRVWHTLLYPHWIWLPIAFAGEVVAYLGYTLAYRELTRAERGPELEVPQAAALVTTGFGVFVHSGGFALDRAALQRAGLSRSDARARVYGLNALEYAVLAPATAVAALLIIVRGQDVDPSLTYPWLIGVPVGAIVALVLLRRKDAFRRRGWRMVVYDALRAIELLVCLVKRPGKGVLALAGISIYWIGDIFCLFATLHAFYANTPPLAPLLVGYATGYALTRRALPLGGAGVVEVLLPFSLGWVGIARAPAVLGVAAYRVINLWLPLVPALAGLPSLRRLQRARA